MDDDDGMFYEDDDPIETLRDEWRRGEPGRTTGTRDLNPRGKAAVEQWNMMTDRLVALTTAAQSARYKSC